MYKFHPYLNCIQVQCEILAYSPAEAGHYEGLPENCEPDEPVVFDYKITPVCEQDADNEIFQRPLTWAEEKSLLQQFEVFYREF